MSPALPSLPERWQQRLLPVEREGLRLWFLDPNDAACALALMEQDREWFAAVRAGRQ